MPPAKRSPSASRSSSSAKRGTKSAPSSSARKSKPAATPSARQAATRTAARGGAKRTATSASGATKSTAKTAGRAASRTSTQAKASAKRTATTATSGVKRTARAATAGAKQTRTSARMASTSTRRAAAGSESIISVAEQLVRGTIKPRDVVLLTRERIQATLDEAAALGRVTSKDANALVSELVRHGRSSGDGLIAEVETLLGRGRRELGSATRRARASGTVDRLVRGADRARRGAGVGPSFPIVGYDSLNAAQVQARIGELRKPELRRVLTHERKNANRKSVVGATRCLAACGCRGGSVRGSSLRSVRRWTGRQAMPRGWKPRCASCAEPPPDA
ncbi:MAG: hypothetical protein ACRDMJ_05420, partial [Solirubrobacteraceae bacterium]